MAEKPQERVINVVLPDGRQGRLRVPASFTDEQVAEQMAVLGARPVEQPGFLARLREAAQPAANNLADLIVAALSPNPERLQRRRTASLETLRQTPQDVVTRVVSELINPVPGSAAEAGALLATLGASRLLTPTARTAATASDAARQLLGRSAVRTAAAAGGAAAGSQIEHGQVDPMEVLFAAGPVAAVEGAAHAVGAGRRAFGAGRLQASDVAAVTDAINRTLPGSIPIRPTADVASLSNAAKKDLPQSIARQAGEAFRRTLETIDRVLTGAAAKRPSVVFGPDGRPQMVTAPVGEELRQAVRAQIDLISRRGTGIRSSPQGTMTGAGQRAAAEQHEMVEDLSDALAAAGFRDVADLYRQARSDYFRSLSVARLLDAPGVIKGGRLNMQALQEALARTAGLRGSGVPDASALDLRDAIFRGAPSMAATDMPGGFGVMRLLLSLTRPRIGLTERLGGLGLPDFAGTPERLQAVLPPDATVADVLALLATQRASEER